MRCWSKAAPRPRTAAARTIASGSDAAPINELSKTGVISSGAGALRAVVGLP
jgi:hypothetical protein